MSDLKPCPFCGSPDLFVGSGTEDREGLPVYVGCGECGALGPWVYTREKSVLGSIEIVAEMTGWNKRT